MDAIARRFRVLSLFGTGIVAVKCRLYLRWLITYKEDDNLGLKVLELFAGTRSISKAFEVRGHETFAIEWDEQHPDIDWYADIGEITAEDILERFGRPDVIWASPDCTTYSIAAISYHRVKESNGNLAPKSERARINDAVNKNVLRLISELNPVYYFIENPRGGMRKMRFMQDLPRYTVT